MIEGNRIWEKKMKKKKLVLARSIFLYHPKQKNVTHKKKQTLRYKLRKEHYATATI